MKVIKTILLVMLCAARISALSTDPVITDPGKKARLTSTTTLSGVFFEDFSSGTIFIDFEGLIDPLYSISILKNAEILFADPVGDLPLNTIYELNTELMKPGNYTLELELSTGQKIHKDIWVE